MSEKPTDYGVLFKRALRTLDELQRKLDTVERPLTEPVAVIGMGCRFPGGAKDPATFWALLQEGFDGVTEIPPERWDVDGFYDPTPGTPGKMYTRRGAFLEDVDRFDPHFFGISPREALAMDPQQRLVLEVCWEAIEDAGLAPQQLVGSPTGVFLGISASDYNQLTIRAGEPPDAYSATGTAHSISAGRVSYFLGLQGPNLALDTACSSSLVALHLACQSLRLRESGLAFACGVNLVLSPDSTVATSQARMMSGDGRCKTFDAAADGYVRGEGCGVLLLKRLSEALADGDRILALIRGTAVNQDGRSNGITAPNGLAQEAVIREALRRAGLSGTEIAYVEAHGTGTSLGDPIEVRALGAVLGENRPMSHPFLIGSVKTNIGHLESAAGVAGLIKTILALQHEEIPPHLNFKTPNPLIPWAGLPIRVVTERTPWPRGKEKRFASVSSFGFSGTNAHVILEEAPNVEIRAAEIERPVHILTLSAKRSEALSELAVRYRDRLDDALSLSDACFTANTGRGHFSERCALVAASIGEAREKLDAAVSGQRATGVVRGQTGERGQPSIAFLFTGQGAQYVGMGRQLYETQPTFRKTLARCDELLRPHLDRPLLDVLYPPEGVASPIDETAYTQPALFALEYALAELWRSWGVEPTVVMGHSVGEYVAACVGGLFSLEDGLRLIAARARLMQALPGGGAMAAVFADERRVTAALSACSGRVSIAAVNGPGVVVVSGEGAAVRKLLDDFVSQGVRTQPLIVSHAFHSPLMEPMLEAFEQAVRGIAFATPHIGIVSNVTGSMATPEELAGAGYWRRHVREPVRFAAGMETLREQGCEVFVEMGPHPTLLGMGARCLPDGTGLWLPSLRKGRDDWHQILESVAALYVQGAAIDWAGFDRDYPRRRVALPTYPFQRERFWLDAATRGARPQIAAVSPRTIEEHPLLGRRLRSPLKEVQYESQLGCDRLPFLRDHAFFSVPVFPAAGYIEMALSAVSTTGSGTPRLEDLSIEEPLLLADDEAQTVQLTLSPDGAFQIFSSVGRQAAGPWKLHVRGRASLTEAGISASSRLEEVRARCERGVDVETYYHVLQDRGVEYGAGFQAIEAAWSGADEAIAHARVPDASEGATPYVFHPVLLDAGFQLLGAALADNVDAESSDVYMPTLVKRLVLLRAIESKLWIHVVRLAGRQDGRTLAADISFFNEAGELAAILQGLEMRRVKSETLAAFRGRALGDMFYQVVWEEKPLKMPPVPAAGRRWLILGDGDGLANDLARGIEAHGDRAITTAPGMTYRKLREDSYELNMGRRGDVEALVADIVGGEREWGGIVYLVASDLSASAAVSAVEAERLSVLGILHLVQSLATLEVTQAPPLWFVTRDAQAVRAGDQVRPEQTSLWGLGRTIGAEMPYLRCVQIDLGRTDEDRNLLLSEMLGTEGEDQVAYRGGVRFVARLGRIKVGLSAISAGEEAQAVQLQIATRGVLDNLQLVPVKRRAPNRGEVEIQVEAAGLNFRDVLNALGMYPGDPGPLGGECAGRVVAVGEDVREVQLGDEVMGLAGAAFSSHVTVRFEALVRKPARLSLEESATIPIVFLTAHYGLNRLARLHAGERVLIHAGTGGVGMAAIQLAQNIGAEIFATAGSPEKRGLLKSLGAHHVMDSRSLSFAEEVRSATNGEGVDVVLNSLADEFIPKSLSLLRKGGRFLELGKRGIWTHEQVRQAHPDIEYHIIYLGDLADNQPILVREMLGELVEAFEAGSLKPLPRTVFPMREAAQAFRYMAQAKHVGKIVLRQDTPRGTISPNATYLLTGGHGGLGLVVTRWLAEQGARHIALVSRSAPGAAAAQCVAALEARGTRVKVLQADVAQRDGLARALAEVETSMPPLRGVVHAAGVLDDGILVEQTWERFERVLAPKVAGAWNLHNLTRKIPLDFFVMFSSMASVLGSPGQGNYAAANAFLDGLAWHRRREGLPGLTINWGPWGEVGMAARLRVQDQRRHADKGVDPILPAEGAAAFGQLLRDEEHSQVVVAPIRWARFLEQWPRGNVPVILHGLADATGANRPIAGESAAQSSALLQQLAEAPTAQRRELILGHVRALACRVLGMPATQPLDVRKPLNEMGLDSLMAVELRNALSASFGTTFPATLLFDYPAIEDLAGELNGRFARASIAEASEATSGEAAERAKRLAEVRELSDAEAESLIKKELGDLTPR